MTCRNWTPEEARVIKHSIMNITTYMNNSQSDYGSNMTNDNISNIRAEVSRLLNEGQNSSETCGLAVSEFPISNERMRDIYDRLPRQNFCRCMFERRINLAVHRVNTFIFEELFLRLEREFPTFSRTLRTEPVIDLASLFCPCYFMDYEDPMGELGTMCDSILWTCECEGFDAREALTNFILSDVELFIPRVLRFYRELRPIIVPQMRPVKSCVKGANKNRSSEVDKKFLKPKPNPFIKNPVKRYQSQQKEQDRVVTKYICERRRLKQGDRFETQMFGISETFTEASHSIEMGAQAVEDLADVLKKGITHRVELTEDLLAALNQFKNVKHDIEINLPSCENGVVKVIALCGVAAVLYIYKDKILSTTGGTTAVIAAVSAAIGLGFGSRLQQWFDEFKPQSFTCDTEYLSSILFSVLSVGTYTDNQWKDKFKECSKLLNSHGRVTTALSDVLNFCIDTLEKIARFIVQDVCGCSYETLIHTGDAAVNKWRDEVDNLSLLAKQETFPINTMNHSKILKLQREGLKFEKRFEGGGRSFKRPLNVVQQGMKTLEKIQEPFLRAAFAKNKLRPKPLTVLLIGKSGVGKSAVTIPLIQSVLARTLNMDDLEHFRQNPMDFVYTCAFETKFWDGFYDQEVVVFDDFLQTKDGPSEPDGEAMKLIRASNLFPYLLHMAHLEDKANHYFNASMIVATTNNASLVSELLREPEALVRRFDVPVFVYPKLEYCVNKDPNMPIHERRLMPMERFSFDVYEFHLKSFNVKNRGWDDIAIFNYEGMVEYIAKMHRRQSSIGDNYLSTVNDHLEREIAQRKAREAARKEKFEPQSRYVSDDGEVDQEQIHHDTDMPKFTRYPPKWYEAFDAWFYRTTNKALEDADSISPVSEFAITILSTLKQWKNTLVGIALCSGIIYGFTKYFDSARRTLRDVIDKFCTRDDGTVHVPTELLKYPEGHNFTDADLQSVGLTGGKLQQAKVRVKQTPELELLKTFSPQIFKVCKTTEQVADKILRNNWYNLIRPDGVLIGSALALKGDLFLLNAHYYADFVKWSSHEFEEIYFVHPEDYLTGVWEEVSFKVLIENIISQAPTEQENLYDSWIVRVQGMKPHKDIVHLFACEATYELFKQAIPGVVYYMREHDQEKGIQPYLRCMTRSTKLSPVLQHGDVKWADYISFPLLTKSGDCGALLFVNEDFTHGGRLIGIHAGYSHGSKLAVGVVCTRERIEKLLDKFNWVPPAPTDLPDFRSSLFSLQIRGVAPHVYYPLGTSKLRKSPCYGVLGEGNKQPAVLKPCGRGNPIEVALTKYGGANRQVSARDLKIAVNDYKDMIHKIHSKRKREVYSFETACIGIPNDPYVNAIPRNTSAGYPYNTYVSRPGKWDIFGEDEEYSLDTKLCKRLREEVEDIETKLKQGVRSQHFYVDCLKDELRSDKKVKECNTRMFSACPLPLTVLIKQYFGDFCGFFLENRLKNESIVSINPFSEWDTLAKILDRRGDRCVAGDFTKFDASQYSQILQSIVDIINDWYNDSPENQNVRRLLWCEVWNSHHINSGLWMEWVKSLPSGHPLTTIINTIFVSLVFRLCFMKKFKNSYSIRFFREYVTLFANGDDHVFGLSEQIANDFNYFTLPDLMSSIGLTYTAEDKEESKVPFKKLSECEFLKRGFKLHNGKWIAPLNWDVIRQMPYWYRKGPDVPKRICDNVDCALREATMHGEEKFEEVYNACYSALQRVGLPPPVHDYSYYYSALALEWYEGEPSETTEERELLVNVNSSGLDGFEDTNVSSYLGLQPGETENSQVTSCTPRDECIEVQVKALAATEGNKMVVEATNEKPPSMLHSQGELNATTTTSATMHFTEGRGSVAYSPFDIKSLNNVLLRNSDTFYQDIRTFLEKPIKINTFTWSTASSAGTTLYSTKIPFDAAMDSNIALFKNKLAGFMGFRGTAVIKVACSVNKFAQGRLLLHFIPGIPNIVPQSQNMYLYDLTTRTQQPRVDLDIGMQTEAEIRIPFVNASLFYDLTTGTNPWAKFYITIYSALVGPASSITGSVFLSFKDTEFIIPTSVQPQSSSTRKRGNVTEEETYKGPLSSRLSSISEAFSKLSQVPELSSVAGTAGWVAECMAKSARMFGFSKPAENEPGKIVANVHYSNALNFDGINNHVPLGMSARNKVDVLPGFAGNDIDELSIKYIIQRAAFVRSITWSTTDAVDVILWSRTLGPTSEYNTYTIGGNSCYTAPPLTWVGNLFGYFRGDIVLHFKFVKTQFHTGKLMLTFEPSTALTTMTTSKASYVHTEVIDISEKSEFHVRLPYCRLTPWMLTGTLLESIFGTVSLVVLTPLNAPATVSSNISILVEISGADNVEFAGLRDFAPTPMLDTTFVPQIQEIDDMEGEDGIVSIGNAKISRDPFVCEQFCIGEKITSLKQLLLRHSRVFLGSTGNIKSFQIDPFGCGGTKYNGTTTTFGPMSRDLYSCISAGYVLARGGMCFIWQNTGDNVSTSTKSVRASLAITRNPTHSLLYTSSSALYDFNTGTYVTNVYCSPSLAVHIPAWGLSHSRYVITDFDNTARGWAEAEPRVLLAFVNPSTSATIPQLANCSLFRAMSDDGGLGYFIGFPLFQAFQDWSGAPNL